MCGGIFVDLKYLECADLGTMEEQVKEYMKKGWHAVGGLTVSAFYIDQKATEDGVWSDAHYAKTYVQRIELWKPKPKIERTAVQRNAP